MKKKGFIVLVIISICVLLFLVDVERYGQIKYIFSSVENIQRFVKGFGIWAPLIFFIVQLLQVIVAPIPGNVTGLVGGAMFGVVKGFLLSGAGIFLGSITAFYIARMFGQPLVVKLVGREVFDKYAEVFHNKGFMVLLLIFLFPFFPDDALCFIAGLSSMKLTWFAFLVLFGRMPGVLVSTLAGAGIVDFSLFEWAVIAGACLVLAWLFIKYNNKFQQLISK